MKRRAVTTSRLTDIADAPGGTFHLTMVRHRTHHIDIGTFASLSAAEMRAAELLEVDDWIDSGVVRLAHATGPVASVVGGG